MSTSGLRIVLAPSLRIFLHRRQGRHDGAAAPVVRIPPTDPPSLGHVVQSVGVPLTEVGALLLDGVPVAPALRSPASGQLDVMPPERPQGTPTSPPRFVLDVHLGALARRMRLLGLDVSYRNDAQDDALVAVSLVEQRVLLTRDRGVLQRRALRWGAYVRGQRCDDQLRDVLERYAPPLRPWTRCVACNGLLQVVGVDEVAELLQPGTLRTYRHYVRCIGCGRPYWQGAHAPRLQALVSAALLAAGRRPPTEVRNP